MDLAQEPAEVVDAVDRLRGDDDVARPRGDVAEIGEVGLDALDGDLGGVGAPAELADALGVGVDGDRLGAG